MTQPEMEQFKMKIKQDYVILLDLLSRVVAADNYLSVENINNLERLSTARALTNKFIEHAVTILRLSQGTNLKLPSFKFSFIDSASIDVLTRTAMEAFLIFHYVFFVPTESEEKDYRYWAYKIAGITERQNFPANTEIFKQKLESEKIELDKLHEKLKSNTIFQRLTDKQKKLIFKGRWKLSSWSKIAIDAGLKELIASHMYSSLAGYAHSSMLSVFQTIESHINKEDELAVNSSMGIMNIVIANMIREYCGLFPKAKELLSKDNKESNILWEWIQIGTGSNGFVNQ